MPLLDLGTLIDSREIKTGDEKFNVGSDPTAEIPGMAPNFAKFLLPHVVSFQGTVSTLSKVYRYSDEAMRHSFENARFMRNDPVVMECVEMRQRACALLNWHLEPEDPKDKDQLDLCQKLTKTIERIPFFMQYRENLLNATFYGRYAVQNRWRWRKIGNNMRLSIAEWKPIHGDKLVWRYDDGGKNHMPDQLGIRCVQGSVANWTPEQLEKLSPTDRGMAYFLDTWERPLVSVHRHFIEDGEFEDPWSAGRIHGNGIRSRIYWAWYQKQEILAFMMEYLERSAMGFELWYYPMHNPEAQKAVRKAATERSEIGRNVVLVPRPVGDETGAYDVQRIEPSMAGVTELRSVIEEYYGHMIKRYILGQTLTTEADATGLGSGVADIHLETFMGIVRYDATLLEETITNEVVEPTKRYNHPDAANIDVRFRVDTEQPDSSAKMEAFQMAFNLGMPIRAQELRDLIGAAKPEDDDEVLSIVDLQRQLAEINASQQQATGVPGGPGEGDEPNADEIVQSQALRSTGATPHILPGVIGRSGYVDGGDRVPLQYARGRATPPRASRQRTVELVKRAYYAKKKIRNRVA